MTSPLWDVKLKFLVICGSKLLQDLPVERIAERNHFFIKEQEQKDFWVIPKYKCRLIVRIADSQTFAVKIPFFNLKIGITDDFTLLAFFSTSHEDLALLQISNQRNHLCITFLLKSNRYTYILPHIYFRTNLVALNHQDMSSCSMHICVHETWRV